MPGAQWEAVAGEPRGAGAARRMPQMRLTVPVPKPRLLPEQVLRPVAHSCLHGCDVPEHPAALGPAGVLGPPWMPDLPAAPAERDGCSGGVLGGGAPGEKLHSSPHSWSQLCFSLCLHCCVLVLGRAPGQLQRRRHLPLQLRSQRWGPVREEIQRPPE